MTEIRDSSEQSNEGVTEVEVDAVAVISDTDDDRTIAEELLAKIANATDDTDYRHLRDRLWGLGDAAILPMRAALSSKSIRQRMASACNLGRLSDVASLGDLIKLLADPAGRVREMAIFGLGVLGRPEAIEPILECFNDYDSDVRYRVLVALKDLGYDDLEDILIKAMRDDNYGVRDQALRTLRDDATVKSLTSLVLALLETESKMQLLAEQTLDRVVKLCGEPEYAPIAERITPRQARLVMNYLEGRNLHEVWPSLHRHLAARVGSRTSKRGIDRYGRILTEADEIKELQHAYLREDTLDLMLDYFTEGGSSRSLLLVGPAGSGKTAIIHEFIRRLHEVDDEVTVLETNTSELMTGTRYLGDWETKLKEMMDAVTAQGNVIIYVTNPNDLLGAGAHSKSNECFADFFKPYLQRGDLRMIAETTAEAMKGGLVRDPGFLRLFERVRIEAMSDADTLEVLARRLPNLVGRGGRKIEASREILDELTDYARSFITRTDPPGRACDLLDSVIEYIGRERSKKLGADDDFVLEHSDIPGALAATTHLDLALLDDQIALDLPGWRRWFEKRLIAQQTAVDAIVSRVALIKSGMRDGNRPLGTLFLVGPTGVGKTYLAKLVSERIFGDPDRMIRFDLSEYQGRSAMEKLIGSPHNKDREGLLTEAIHEQPYCVLLLDEFEKADPEVYHLFLQVFDEGRLTDAHGKTADFRQALIMITSNLGSSRVNVSPLGFSEPSGGLVGNIRKKMEEVFQPEFLNRLDDVVVFEPLGEKAVRKVVDIEVQRMLERRGFRRHRLKLKLSAPAKAWLAKHGFSRRFGARELKRCIEKDLLTPLAELLVRTPTGVRDRTIMVRVEEGELRVTLTPPITRGPEADRPVKTHKKAAPGA